MHRLPASQHPRRARLLALGLFTLGLVAGLSPAHAAPRVPSFLPRATYTTSGLPRFVTTADMNEDGRLDLVVSCPSNNTISILPGDGAGGFGTRTSASTQGAAGPLAVGRVDGDTHLDVVASQPTWNFINVLLGTGTGALSSPLRTYTHSYTTDVRLFDYNNTSGTDLAVSSTEIGGVDLLTGANTGAFTLSAWPVTGTTPAAVEAGDLNGDGRQDLVVTNTGANKVSVLLSTAVGAMGGHVDYATGTGPVASALGDLDGDGDLDVVTVNSTAGTVSVLLGTGLGTFAPALSYPAGTNPKWVEIADINGDGRQDLLVATPNSNSIQLLLRDESGAYTSPSPMATGNQPEGLTVADLDGNGMLDIVTADYSAGVVSVFRQTVSLLPSNVTLGVSATSIVFGTDVVATATVSPASIVSGTVSFRDGSTPIANATLAGNSVSVPLSGLTRGTHSLTAVFEGDGTYSASTSAAVAVDVALAPTTTTLTSSGSPSGYTIPVTLTATVSSTAPGSGVPAGTVRFVIDGTGTGVLGTLSGGVARIGGVTSMTIGAHTIEAVYQPADGLRHATSVSAPLPHVVVPSGPQIVRVGDVPNDQGGKVFVAWRCLLDQPGITTILSYRVWRRLPPARGAAMAARGADEDAARFRVERVARPDSSVDETFWEAIASLPAARLVSYGYTAGTPQDSMAGSNPYTSFVIQAVTAADEFRGSPPDSGYSVDNLAPPAPSQFAARYAESATVLCWSGSRAPDVDHYRIYRGARADFVPGPDALVATLRDTTWTDAAGSACYRLAAVDAHGNVGRTALVSPGSPSAALATLVASGCADGRVSLLWYLADDEPATLIVYRRTLASDWMPVATVTADATGDARYEETGADDGVRYGYRLGVRAADGAETFSDVAWVDRPLAASALAVTVPNPVTHGDVTVSFAPPPGPPRRVDLLDVSGRVVVTREVMGGLGRQTVSLIPARALAPGLYLVRVGLDRPVVTRVAVIR